jgi:hypothetical protein
VPKKAIRRRPLHPVSPINELTCRQVVRGYFGVGNSSQDSDYANVVNVTSTDDFLVCIWARNIETFKGGIQMMTPPSQFRGVGETGPQDGLVLDIPPQTGMDLGCIGGRGGETLNLSSAFGARVGVFLTVITSDSATVNMTAA